ncbi:MAG TPA: HAMP domain-containing sensor histidine kinase [Muribaculum sp.]|jgi:signal transduction histidine kinase|uniref:histidine kinase n=1 Tax=Heminiphilus faecis TaxID=2601703 RepID=A0ABV4CX46_9BACT|nr:sensor histidine kinase [bacterium J10(2018)]HRF68894.1 HAMP domain-containing sensor histidine kinase [Muribaculum sp.]
MKRFKTISTAFIFVIAIIFGCNVYYLISLYNSIRNNVERDVMTAIADADIDDMWERAARVNRAAKAACQTYTENGDSIIEGPRSISGVIDGDGNLITTTTNQDGKTQENRTSLNRDRSYTNQMVNDISRQMHETMDPYVDFNLTIMDSIVIKRLADRHIYPDFVAVEVVNSKEDILRGNSRIPLKRSDYDVFSLCINPESDMYYRAYMTPLTHHIVSEMSGVIVTILLLMVSFSLAFGYLFHTVSHLRTIEEMKDDFVSNMTHELKTPIAIAYSANDALLNYDTANDQKKKVTYLNIANKQLKRLGELVENILAMSMERRKTIKLKPETILLRPFVEEIASAQRMRGDKDITISVNVDEDVVVESDKTHLANVLNNLIDNAVKYSAESVVITIAGDSNGISVIDNGIGIPAKAIPYLFNKFYRVPHGNRQDVRGYGIGLYYVKSILDKMGWDIEVKSHEGEGSVFTIKIGKHEK